MSPSAKRWAAIAATLAAGTLFLMWSAQQDGARMQANAAYEGCVKKEYGMTPIKWYEEQGAYPDCPMPDTQARPEVKGVAAPLLEGGPVLLAMANKERKGAGLYQLIESVVLDELAAKRAVSLCESGQWSHDGWEAQFEGTKALYYGENLARGFTSDADAEAALMASPSHRANILLPDYWYMGVGEGDCGLQVELFMGF